MKANYLDTRENMISLSSRLTQFVIKAIEDLRLLIEYVNPLPLG